MLKNLSYHMTKDHLDRSTEILMTIGLGKEIYRRRWVDQYGRDVVRALTSTGIMICYAPNGMVITMFVPTVKQIHQLYRKNHCPEYIYKVIKKNQIRFKHLQYTEA